MRRLLTTVLAPVLGAVLGTVALGAPTLGAALSPAPALAAGYPGVTRTTCSVSGIALTPDSGARPGVTVQVSTGNMRPTGRVTLTFRHQPGGERWSERHAYAGGVLRLTSARLAHPGTYRVSVVYDPSRNSLYRSCRGSTSFRYTAQALADASGTRHQGTPGAPSGHTGTTQTSAHDGTATDPATGTTSDGTDRSSTSGSRLHGLLAATGNPVTLTLVVAALALLVVGLSLMRPTTRRRGGRGSRR